MNMIDRFQGEYRWLSNFWPVDILFEGQMYPSVEHAYQAAKTLDLDERRRIALLKRPGDAKRAGRYLTLRADWTEAKLKVMEELLRCKFANEALRKKLRATAGMLIMEGNTWGDTYWGTYDGKGDNHLGKLLMKVRTEI